MSKMYTCEQVAYRYGVKIITVWDWIRKKKLNAIKLGREYRVTRRRFDSVRRRKKKIEGGEMNKCKFLTTKSSVKSEQ